MLVAANKMNIQEALSKNSSLANSKLFSGYARSPEVTYITGAIEEDDGEYFRIYTSPVTPFRYFRVPQEAVIGEIIELQESDLEKIEFKILPNFHILKKNAIFQIPLRTGVAIQVATIKEAKIGEYYPSDSISHSQSPAKACGCKEKGSAEAASSSLLPGRCVFRSPCRTGCYWENDYGDGWCSSCPCY